jgi:hypothetical protein
MNTTLTITFTGLFLFTRRAHTLHVLLPRTGTSTGHEKHFTCFSRDPLNCGAVFDDPGVVEMEGLNPCSLGDVQIPSVAHDLESITSKKLPPRQLGGSPTSALHLRMELPLPSEAFTWGKRAAWKFGTDPQEHMLSNQLIYTLHGQTISSVSFTRKPFGSNAVVQRVTFPVMGQPLNLHFAHIPTTEVCPSGGYEATHFDAYYSLYDTSVTRKNPKLVYTPTEACPFEQKRISDFTANDWRDASTYTCMVAKVDPT